MAVKSAVYDYSLYTPDYYLKGFLAGGKKGKIKLIGKYVSRNQISMLGQG